MANGRGRHAKKIETVHWTHFSDSALALSAGTVAGTLLSAQHLPETLLRTRGEIVVYKDGTSTPGLSALIGVGIILVPEGLGTTVTWAPVTDGDAPWLWVDYFTIGYEEMVTDVVDIPMLSGARRIIDSKAMRKNRNRELQFVVENATIGGALSVNVIVAGRVLAGS